MFPPQQGISLDLDALSGICGSISIACWVVVFSPQIIENFRRGSAEGLSIVFIVVWLAGDVFNILGAILQGVLPTMIILAVYYTLADIVLLGQCFYYRGFTLSDEIKSGGGQYEEEGRDETRPLLNDQNRDVRPLLRGDPSTRPSSSREDEDHHTDRTRSVSRLRRHLSIDASHLSPVTPLLDPPKPSDYPVAVKNARPTSTLQAVLFNTFTILLVCAAGVLGWWIGVHKPRRRHHDEEQPWEPLQFDMLGQVFGYLCAVLYLGSRVPQLLLNYKRKSTEGVSLLFFLFACIGNLTYDMSIFAYSPVCREPDHCRPGEAKTLYLRYIAVNASWIAGSLGTLLLDMAIFVQFFLYQKREEDYGDGEVAVEDGAVRGHAA
ncbi:hypothetical protein A1O1_07532 [Capronia coronata CBS 617.96]|uniref:PQ-loop-domain-containing protein n=1 Tax=Capronia coronata CBS 617.96 TaxID=1182541 RepID=W9XUL8_9EURO|nr:uncharacterized protein A1O1_07532 [Capronia coronata CBS 617.96]EXJ83903.1 hypothetical protein A1O1_07532 [Capronia coronata CBS 617.96]